MLGSIQAAECVSSVRLTRREPGSSFRLRGGREHVSERFGRLLALYRKPDGREWGGQDLENAIGGAVTRSYVANLKKGRIENSSLAKLKTIAEAMGAARC